VLGHITTAASIHSILVISFLYRVCISSCQWKSAYMLFCFLFWSSANLDK